MSNRSLAIALPAMAALAFTAIPAQSDFISDQSQIKPYASRTFKQFGSLPATIEQNWIGADIRQEPAKRLKLPLD